MKERAIQTLGYFPVGDGDFPHQKLLLQGLMDSVEVRNWCILFSSVFLFECFFCVFWRQFYEEAVICSASNFVKAGMEYRAEIGLEHVKF